MKPGNAMAGGPSINYSYPLLPAYLESSVYSASEAKLPYPVYSCASRIQAVREGARREGSATGVVPLHGPLHARLPAKDSIHV